MAELHNIPCPTCGGDREIHSPAPWGIDDDKPGDYLDCPDCQLDGIPTGLKWPMLVERCRRCNGKGTYYNPADGTGKAEPCKWFRCHNGYAPKSAAEQIVALLEHPDCGGVVRASRPEYYLARWGNVGGNAKKSPYDALIDALKAAAEAAGE